PVADRDIAGHRDLVVGAAGAVAQIEVQAAARGGELIAEREISGHRHRPGGWRGDVAEVDPVVTEDGELTTGADRAAGDQGLRRLERVIGEGRGGECAAGFDGEGCGGARISDLADV